MGIEHPTPHIRDMSPIMVMDGPVLVFGGCYGNLEATRALLEHADTLGIPPSRMMCTGDVVAYCADGAATVRLLRAAGLAVVMGNCEESLGASAGDCGCGFSEGSTCDALSAAWYAHADATIDDETRAWMRSLPRRLDIAIGGRRLAVVHGSLERINDFIFASSDDGVLRRQLEAFGGDGVIGGHCGLPFTRFIGGRVWHNAGAVGMPANDGTPSVWFSIIEPTPDGLRFRHEALRYDTTATVAKMRAAGLPEDYAAALDSGLWPSCDVLPLPERAMQGAALSAGAVSWGAAWPVLKPGRKFSDPAVTASGERRAQVALTALRTLWINTGTLCNVACRNCYIDSSPRNDRLAYISRSELRTLLYEAVEQPALSEIGFTGGEPFMNPDIIGMLDDVLDAGYRALVLTNAMKPMQRRKAELLGLRRRYGDRLTLRVSLDHYTAGRHEELRGPRSWQPTLEGLLWLAENGFDLALAGRTIWGESEVGIRDGYRNLMARLGIPLDVDSPARLVLFPEMDEQADVPEITERCWGILGKSPDSVMCASSRMVVKRKGARHPSIVACTLLPYDEGFEMGGTLAEAGRPVALNHPHCARFCVLGGGSCSTGG